MDDEQENSSNTHYCSNLQGSVCEFSNWLPLLYVQTSSPARNNSAIIIQTYITLQGVIQDFEVEGGNEKSNQKMLLKKGQLLFQYPAMDTQS